MLIYPSGRWAIYKPYVALATKQKHPKRPQCEPKKEEKMLVNELFEALTDLAPFKVLGRSDEEYFAAEFMSNGRKIKFNADKNDDVWNLEFAEIEMSDDKVLRHQFKKTGRGGEFQVFATIKAIIDQFIKDYRPNVMYFTADKDDKSRSKLYKTLSQKFAPANYDLVINPPLESLGVDSWFEEGEHEIFAFIKKGFDFKRA